MSHYLIYLVSLKQMEANLSGGPVEKSCCLGLCLLQGRLYLKINIWDLAKKVHLNKQVDCLVSLGATHTVRNTLAVLEVCEWKTTLLFSEITRNSTSKYFYILISLGFYVG